MTNYKNIFGKPVKFLSADPDNAEAEGQIWYNSTAGAFKNVLVNEAWSSAAPLVVARSAQGKFGTQTSGVAAGGRVSPPTLRLDNTEEYNGTGFSNATAIPAAAYNVPGFGSQTAGAIAGGNYATGIAATTSEYNGSSWTAGGGLNTGRQSGGAAGTQTAGLLMAGEPASGPPYTSVTEEYNGTSWASGNPAPVASRAIVGSAGIQTAASIFGGYNGSGLTSHELYDGTNWTTGPSMNTARWALGGSGVQTLSIGFGGANPGASYKANAETYNGTSWTEGPDLATARRDLDGGIVGTAPSTIAIGGDSGSYIGTSEEFNRSANVITAATFSSGGNANFARRQLGYTGAGTQNAFMVYGGFSPSGMVNNSEEYGGASWTATPTLNTARGQLAGFGITTAAVACGGATPTIGTYTEEYNGSTWTTVTSMSTTRYEYGASGIESAGIALQGDQGPSTPFGTTCEEYDGSAWTAGGTANTARRTNSGVGTQTATITAGGQTSPGSTANVESYDGTSWSEVNNLNVSRGGNAIMGGPAGATSSVITGGNVPTQYAITEQWNGTSMVSGVNMANDRSAHGAGGTSASGIVGLGQTGPSPPYGDVFTEEYEGETTANNVKTITTS
jgi:hypothetical protein